MTDHLTALDAAFLELEEGDSSAHMHIGWTMVFDPLPGGGAPAVDEVRRLLEDRLSLLPRFRRRLSTPDTGALSWPTWIADEEFEIAAQVPHATLPEPGGQDELLEWLGGFYSRRLDRTRPLWEMTLLDGLSDGKWAIAVKVHHCLVDGMSGASVVGLMLDPESQPGPSRRGCWRHSSRPPTQRTASTVPCRWSPTASAPVLTSRCTRGSCGTCSRARGESRSCSCATSFAAPRARA